MAHTTAAQPAKGATLGYATTQAGTYTQVALRTSYEGPDAEKEKVETTDFDSGFKKYRDSAMPDLGELKIDIWWDPGDATHQALQGWAQGASPNVWWHWAFQDAKQTTLEFQGFVSAFGQNSIEPTSNLAASVTIVLTSVPTATAGNPTG